LDWEGRVGVAVRRSEWRYGVSLCAYPRCPLAIRIAVSLFRRTFRYPAHRTGTAAHPIAIQAVLERSRPSWRDGVPDRDTPGCRTGLQTVTAGIQDDGSPSRAPYGSSEQRLATASWIREQQAAVSIAGAPYRHPARPIGTVRRRIDPQDVLAGDQAGKRRGVRNYAPRKRWKERTELLGGLIPRLGVRGRGVAAPLMGYVAMS
jgi:hypothetical protein